MRRYGANSNRQQYETRTAISIDEYVFKFLVIGDYGVGKTAIVRRYSEGKFSSNYKITIGADFSLKRFMWDENTKISLQLWDIAGHEKFGYMTRVYYKHAIGCAIVFDVTRYATYESVNKWLIDVREKIYLENGKMLPVIILANKCDIEEKCISKDILAKYCRDNGVAAWFFTSAKESINIEEAFNTLIKEAMRMVKESNGNGPLEENKDLLILKNQREERSHCC